MEQTAIERLKEFIQWAKKHGYVRGEKDFEAMCGLSNGYINNMSSAKKGSVGSDKIALVANKFSMLNVRWLCTGKGSMVMNKETYDTKISEALTMIQKLESTIKSMGDK